MESDWERFRLSSVIAFGELIMMIWLKLTIRHNQAIAIDLTVYEAGEMENK